MIYEFDNSNEFYSEISLCSLLFGNAAKGCLLAIELASCGMWQAICTMAVCEWRHVKVIID